MHDLIFHIRFGMVYESMNELRIKAPVRLVRVREQFTALLHLRFHFAVQRLFIGILSRSKFVLMTSR